MTDLVQSLVSLVVFEKSQMLTEMRHSTSANFTLQSATL